jgi:Lhr-like helicase
MEREPQGVGLIYITPIKALLNNQAERLGLYTEMVGLRRFSGMGISNLRNAPSLSSQQRY